MGQGDCSANGRMGTIIMRDMLLTGFDAPIEQVMYFDKVVRDHNLLLEPNHTLAFWNIVAVQVPRYERAKEWLRKHGSVLEEDF